MRAYKFGVVGAVGLVALSVCLSDGLGKDKRVNPVKPFMRAKLKYAQQVLEGLATEDFKLIKQGADDMQLMSRAAEWSIVEGPIYAELSAEFRRCCEQLAERAKAKNIKGATMSYMQLTMACVNCHDFVRSTKVARLDDHFGPHRTSLAASQHADLSTTAP